MMAINTDNQHSVLKQTIKRQCGEIATSGNEFAFNGDFKAAAKCYTAAIRLWPSDDPIDFRFYLNRALCNMKMNYFYLALLDANNATRLAETNAKCYFIRSKILRVLNEFGQAELDLKLALKLSPDNEEIQAKLEQFTKRNQMSSMMKEKLSCYDLRDPAYRKISLNYHLVDPKDLPSNLFDYHGLRVENVRQDLDLDVIRSHFSLFGDVVHLKWVTYLTNQRTTKQSDLLVHFNNPASPMFSIAHFRNKTIPQLCQNENRPLEMYFAPSDEQIGLKYYRPKRPLPVKNTGRECYYWRTTGCRLEENCSRLHLPVNKSVDIQLWMKEKVEFVPVQKKRKASKQFWDEGDFLEF